MKKVLIIAYYWPPSGGSGVQRWLKFVKYLRDFGWEPIVYTPENGELPVIDTSLAKDIPEGVTVIRTPIWEPYGLYGKLMGAKKSDKVNAGFISEGKKNKKRDQLSMWIRGNLFIPDPRRFWVRPSVRYLKKYLKEHPVDVIVSTAPPFSMHLIALGLKKEFPELPWLADFRDPWTNIYFYKDLLLSPWADWRHHVYERRVLTHADAVVSVGKTMTQQFLDQNGLPASKFHVISNGYDEADLFKGSLEQDAKFSIAHIGSLMKSSNPELLWKVLSELVQAKAAFREQLEIKLVGKVDSSVMESIAAHGLSTYVRKINYLPHDEVIKEQSRSKVLLLLIPNVDKSQAILTGKLFEYMASGVPILAIGPEDGDAAELIRETQKGFCSGFNNAEALKANILSLFEGKAPIADAGKIAQYSRKTLTGQLAQLLNQLSKP